MTTIDQAYAEYHEAEVKASAAYEQYWLDRCKAENIHFAGYNGPQTWPYCALQAQVGPHTIRLEVNAKQFEGANFYVLIVPPASGSTWSQWRKCKVKSERGWERFLRRLSAPVFL